MPDGFNVKVDLQDFRRQLAEVDRRMRRRAISQGVRDAAKVFRDAAREKAPVLRKASRYRIPGSLRAAITIARSKRAERGAVAFSVIVRASKGRRGGNRDPFYWRFLEGGWIPRGPGQGLRGGARSRSAQRQRLSAGRLQFPFLAPAFQQASGSALAAFERGVERRLAEVQAVK